MNLDRKKKNKTVLLFREAYVLQLPSSGLDYIELDLLDEEKLPKIDEESDNEQDNWDGYDKTRKCV